MDKTVVVVSRRWAGQLIKVDVTTEGIDIAMSLPEFMEALAQEAGSPTTLLTKKALRQRLLEAAERVIAGMKQASTNAMGT